MNGKILFHSFPVHFRVFRETYCLINNTYLERKLKNMGNGYVKEKIREWRKNHPFTAEQLAVKEAVFAKEKEARATLKKERQEQNRERWLQYHASRTRKS